MANANVLGLLALAVILGSGFFWFRAAFALRLPKNRSYYVAIWLAGIVLAAVALAGSPGWVSGTTALLALLGGAFLLLTVAISRQTVASGAIAPGARIPEFSTVDDKGALFESKTLAGTPLLLKFFRGHW